MLDVERVPPHVDGPSIEAVLQARTVIFDHTAKDVNNYLSHDGHRRLDDELGVRAGEIVGILWGETEKKFPSKKVEIAAEKAIELYAMLREVNVHLPLLPGTRKYLWDLIMQGFTNTSDLEFEKKCAQALLGVHDFEKQWVAKTNDLGKTFEGVVRRGFEQCLNVDRLRRLLEAATPESNRAVTKKAAQTVLQKADADDLFSLAKALAASTGKQEHSVQ